MKTFEEIKSKIERYLENPQGEKNIHDEVISYFDGLDAQRQILESSQLLQILKGAMQKRPFSREDVENVTSLGSVALGYHFAYSLNLTLLGYWIYANVETSKDSDRKELHDRIKAGIIEYDIYGWDWNNYNYLFPEFDGTKEDKLAKSDGEEIPLWKRAIKRIGKYFF